MSDFTENTIILIDEEDKEHEFEILDILEVEKKKYAILFPLDPEYADEDEAIIMKFELDENNEEVLFDIETDEEWDKVADAYNKLMEEEDDL